MHQRYGSDRIWLGFWHRKGCHRFIRTCMQNRVDGLYIVLISMHGLIRGQHMELGRDADTGGQVCTETQSMTPEQTAASFSEPTGS